MFRRPLKGSLKAGEIAEEISLTCNEAQLHFQDLPNDTSEHKARI